MEKKEAYKLAKLAGLLLYVPIILFTGPLLGYIIGDYLVNKFHFAEIVLYILMVIGFVSGVFETYRIIRYAFKVEKND